MAGPVVAIIPAKARSRRVPNKNMRPFRGRPLLVHTVEQAVKSRLVDEVYVSTEAPEIRELAEACGARVPFLRPPEMSGDEVHSSVPILHMLEELGGAARYSFCVMLLPTTPLRSARTIDEVVQLSTARRSNVLSVTPFGKTLFHLRSVDAEGCLVPVTQKIAYNFQTAVTPELFYLNGSVYCAPVEEVLAHRTFQYGRPVAYVMNELEAIDIDTEEDFLAAERIATLLEEGVRDAT
jgi:CMP-N-acetylneuraminic acid synthetase